MLLRTITIFAVFVTWKQSLVAALYAASIDSFNGDNSGNMNSQICLDKIGQLDRCLPKLVFYGDRNFDPPKNEKELDKHCALLDENLKCVTSYSRECLPSFARNIYSIMTRRVKTQFGKRCKTKDGRREPQYMEPAHRCMDSFVAHLEHINGDTGEQKRQIELTCCTFQLFQDCIFTVSKQIQCPKRVVPVEKAIEYVKSIINSMGGDLMDFMCGKYDKVSSCVAGYPKVMHSLKQITDKVLNGTMRAQSNSPLKPMLQLFINSQESS